MATAASAAAAAAAAASTDGAGSSTPHTRKSVLTDRAIDVASDSLSSSISPSVEPAAAAAVVKIRTPSKFCCSLLTSGRRCRCRCRYSCLATVGQAASASDTGI